MKNFEEKINALEAYIANVERDLEQINEVVLQQTNEIASMSKELKQLKEQLANLGETPKHEKPPHY